MTHRLQELIRATYLIYPFFASDLVAKHNSPDRRTDIGINLAQ